MSKIFAAYQNELTKYSTRVVEVSQQINQNRAAFAAALAKYQEAVLQDVDASQHEQDMAGLNAELELLKRKADALNSVSKRGANSTIKSAAQSVFRVNQKEITDMQREYDKKKDALLAMQLDYLKALCDIGDLARQSAILREECSLAQADSGLNISVSALGDDLLGQLGRHRGWVFLNPQQVQLAYTSGQLPVDQTFAGVVEGVPKEKIRTDSAEPTPERVYRTKPKPVVAT